MANSAYHDNRGKFAPGNPGGAGQTGKRLMLTPHLLKALEEESELMPGLTRSQSIAVRLLDKAEAMEEWAVKLVYERTEGKVREQSQDDQTPRNPIRLLNLGDDEAA